MSLATAADVQAALGRSLTPDESGRVDNLLDQASDLVVGFIGYWPDPVLAAISRVVATSVAAVFERPSVTTAQYDATGYATSREYAQTVVDRSSYTSAGPWLTAAQKMRLYPYRRAVNSVGCVSEQRGGRAQVYGVQR